MIFRCNAFFLKGAELVDKNNFLTNKFVLFGISCFNILYLVLIGAITGWTFLYQLDFTNEKSFYAFYIILSIIFFFLMLYTRKQFITRFVSMVIPLVVFGLTVINLNTPLLFIPPLVVSLLMFFICKAGDTAKVILGSLYLLLFVVGIVGYTIVSTLFGGSAIETRLDYTVSDENITSAYDMTKIDRLNSNSISPDGKYRYYILDVQDNDRGKVIIVVEPNDLDKHYKLFNLIEAGYTSRIAKYPTRGVTPEIEWVENKEYSEGTGDSRYKLRYRFGSASEWKTSTINIPNKKNYLRFMNLH